jgi:gliding motility-associated-like protein
LPGVLELFVCGVWSMFWLKSIRMKDSASMKWAVLAACCWLTIVTQAQDFTRHNWYFGNSNSAIRFSRSDNTASLATNQKTPFGTGGSAVVSNPVNGDLVFYTDGSVIYDISGTLAAMPNGTGLSGNTTANQPVAVCPVPGASNQYYVFTNNALAAAGGTVLFSIVDMTLFGNAVFPAPPTGEVVAGQKNQPFGIAANSRSEAMITLPHTNGTDYWLITHENGTDNYTVTHVQPGGTFTHTTFTNLTGGFNLSATNFSFHPGSGKIAVTPLTVNRNVAILDFDSSTGDLSLDQFVLNSASTIAGALYDTEWSPNGQYLYISRLNDSGTDAQVLQFDTTNPASTLTPVLRTDGIVTNVARSYGIQIAPDTAIYHIYQAIVGGPFLVGRLTDTDSVATVIQRTPVAFAPNPNFAGTQFPSFAPSFDLNLTVTFTFEGTCSNVPTSFYPTVTPAADSLVWDFGDGFGSSDWSPIHTYQDGGLYNVTVTAFLNGESESASLPVNITQFDLSIQLVSDTTACECELPINNGIPPCPNDTSDDIQITATITGTPLSVIWSNGDTGPVLTPDSAGYYYVVVTDITGCTAYAGVNVREYGAIDQRANIWYFGQNAGIDFNAQPPVAISGPINSPEGVAVISDRNGNVIFSTDGQRVYDRNDAEVTPAPVPPGIGGQPGSTQSAIIMPVPGDETLYYIFTTQEVHGTGTYELRYSLYDVKLNNGDGGVLEHNQLLFTRSTERITGDGGWLIAHEYGNNSFRAYPITSNGIGNPVISSVGSDHSLSIPESGHGYMKLVGNLLVVALSTPGVSNVLEIFDFDATTGVISNPRTADLNSAAGQVYGVEVVGNKIFATITGNPSFIREFYIDYEGNPVLITPSAGPVAAQLGAIQFGPNGQVLVAVNGQSSLGVIVVNPDTLQTSGFILAGFPLAGGTTSTLGLPNFIQSVGAVPQQPGMEVTGVCLDEPTNFTGFGTDSIDEFQWSFGDGFGSSEQVVEHTYAAAGDYIVTLRIFNRCGLDTTIVQTITIFPPPSNPTFLPAGVLQPVLCAGPLTLEATPPPDPGNLSYFWSTGATTRSITVTQPATVSVIILDNISGCTSSGSILVVDNRPPLELGPNLSLCQNEPVAPLNALNPGAVYAWTINGAPAGSSQTQPVDSSLPGVFEYEVFVTDPITNCTVRDSVIFTFSESPAFTALPTGPSACGANDGFIDLTILSPASGLFSYTVTGPSAVQGIDRPAGVVADPNLTNLVAGTYAVVVIDQVSGCASIDLAAVTDNDFTIDLITRQNICDPLILRVEHTAVVTPFTYRVIDSQTAQVVDDGSSSGIPFFDTNGVPSGTYIVEVTSGGCIAASLPQDFQQDATVSVAGFTTDPCTDPISITVNGGTGWNWSGPGIVGSTTLQTISASPPTQGDVTFDVRVTEAGFCPLDTAVTVFVNNNIVADFDQSDACEDQVTLTADATPAAAYTYIWYRNGVQIPGGQVILANLADNGVNYRVEVRNSVSGCLVSSPQKPVFVAGDLQLAMTTTTPCTGAPFTITATSNVAGTAFQWALDGNPIPGANQADLLANAAGLYRVTGTLPGCSRFLENQIILFPSTPGSLPQRALICPDPGNPDPNTQQVLLDAGPGFTSYDWYQDGVQLNAFTQTFTAEEGGVFSVILFNSFGCRSTDQTQVVEECKPRLVAPTAFRPGSGVANPGDASRSNSDFWVLPIFISDDGFQVFIFNRWGELVFQSSDSNFRWNGGYNNNQTQLLPAGTYTYVVKYKSSYRPQDGIQEQRGGVLLVR